MNRGCKGWLWALSMLVASACTEDEPDPSASCPPFCNTPNPVMTGDGGAGIGGGLPDAGGVFDAGGTPGGSPDTGIIVLDGGMAGGDGGGTSDASADASSAVDASAADGSVAADAGSDAAPGQSLPPVTDYTKPGPFKTTVQANVGPNSNYTIFRPDPLGANGFLHAPIIFGPGIFTSADGYSAFLSHLASHGFVTISANSMSGGPGDPGNLSDMTMGLEWLLAQNTQAGVFQGKLAVDRATAMGYSIGATASVQLSAHKAIATTVVIHGHKTMGDPHGPVLMITGTMDVIDEMRTTLTTLEEAPAVLVALPIGHLAVPNELPLLIPFIGGAEEVSASTRYAAPITAWLRYWVNGDQDAKRFFWGDNCEMCKSPWIPPEPNAKWKAQTL